MQNKRKRGRPRTFEREQILALAMENYWQEGLHALSINEVCRRTSLSKPLLYREFGGEDGLLDAVLERYRENAIAPQISLLASDRSFAETIEVMIEFIANASRGCLLVKMRGAPERLGPLTKARVNAIIGDLREAYEAMFVRARGRGEVRSDITPQLAGRYLDTQVTTALRQIAAGDDPDEVRAQARLALAALLPR